MKLYSPSGKTYVHVVEIPKKEIEKIDFDLLKQPKETLKNYYNRLDRKPDVLTNLGFFGMADGSTCFNFINNSQVVASHPQYQWGMGVVGNNNLIYGHISSQKWRDFVTGYPNLIDNGERIQITFAQSLNYNARRTMLGYNKDNIYIICIDLPGANFAEMQDIAEEVGCEYCINLDGGGSTRMLYEGKTVTNGAEDRPVDTALAVYLKETIATNTPQGSDKPMSIYLKPDNTVKAVVSGKTLTISQKIIPNGARASKYVCSYVKKGDLVKPNARVNNGNGKPRGITVHNTPAINVSAETTMAEQYARATYPNLNMNGAVVHYYVSGYDAIWQMLNTDPGSTERGWHASDGNTRRNAHNGAKYTEIGGNLDTIAIECIGDSAEAEDATARLVAYLCKQHNLNPRIDVYTHNYFMKLPDSIVSGAAKNCPQYILPHWNKFVNTVELYYKPANATPDVSAATFKVGDTIQFVGNKHYTNANAVTGHNCKPGPAKITRIYQLGKSKHPYSLVAVKGGGSTVYGWVDECDVKKVAATNKFTPYIGRVTAESLNVRSGPSTNYKVTTTVKQHDVYTIVGENNGWGRLKSGAGWVSLKYIEKLRNV